MAEYLSEKGKRAVAEALEDVRHGRLYMLKGGKFVKMSSKDRKKLKLDLTRTSVYVEKKRLEWLEKNHFNLSSLVRSYLRDLMPAIDDTKNFMIPSYWKLKSDSTFRRRAKKNPMLKEAGIV